MIRHLEHNHVEIFEEFLRESHGLDQNVDVDPLFKKPKKRNMKQKPSTDPSDRTCPVSTRVSHKIQNNMLGICL